MHDDPSAQPDNAFNGGNVDEQRAASIYPEPTKGVGVFRPSLSNTSAVNNLNQTSLKPTGDLNDKPMPVVQVLSVKGVEYTMMTLTLWFVAGALMWSLLSIANGLHSFSVLAFPISLLLVCVPVFALFFLRLRKAELADPTLRFEPSKRRLSQFTQIIAFATCLFNLIGFVYIVITKIGGTGSLSIGKASLNLLIVLAIAGGILVYYWFDEHRLLKG